MLQLGKKSHELILSTSVSDCLPYARHILVVPVENNKKIIVPVENNKKIIMTAENVTWFCSVTMTGLNSMID